MKKIAPKSCLVVTAAIKEVLEDWIPYINTIIVGNGKEFTGHKKVAEFLGIDYYFTHPYHS